MVIKYQYKVFQDCIQYIFYVDFSAWQHGNIACSPPNDSNMKFDKIQELQEEETAKRER